MYVRAASVNARVPRCVDMSDQTMAVNACVCVCARELANACVRACVRARYRYSLVSVSLATGSSSCSACTAGSYYGATGAYVCVDNVNVDTQSALMSSLHVF